ncbi:MAG TPA: universal stress protein [Streptosporangiaceae bacterium]|jgi:nucleotide-binding universal stress UspA family protein|nr:universal stress protein [Streptosporangiaceae bacterium]
MAGTGYGIVAGYDGSAGGGDALRWAAREAWARHTVLTVLLASDLAAPGEPALADLIGLARRRGEHTVIRGLQYAESVVGPARIRAEVTGEPPARVLCERSSAAEMVVLGSHGHGRLPGLLLGSVPWQVAVHGHGRIVVVRGSWRPVNQSPGPVVVGVDGSAASAGAIAFAFEEAALRNVHLVATCALADSAGRLGEMRRMEEQFGQEMDRQEKQHPDITVIREVVAGPPRSVLLSAAREAQMIVVGSRGRGGLDGMSLGSVAQALLHHSSCPVGVVHPD